MYSLESGHEVKAFSVLSLFGHCDEHKLNSKAVLQFLHDTGLYVRVQTLTCGGQ